MGFAFCVFLHVVTPSLGEVGGCLNIMLLADVTLASAKNCAVVCAVEVVV